MILELARAALQQRATVVESAPLITDDWIGIFKLVGALVATWLVPLATFAIIWVRKGGSTAGHTALEHVNNFGAKMDRIDKEHEHDRGQVTALRTDMELSRSHRQQLTSEIGKLGGRMDGYEKQTLEQQRDIMTAITESSRAQIMLVHELEVKIARMDERANFAQQICDGFENLGRQITDAMRERDQREREERDRNRRNA